MKKKLARLLPILLLVCGCATTKLTESGFLNNYCDFQPSADTPGVLVHFPAGREAAYAKARAYHGFIVDPIVVQISPQRRQELGMDPERIEEVTGYFYEEIIKEIEKEGYDVTDSVDEGIIRLRVALTDMVPSKPYLNLHWTTKLMKAGVGGASVEAEFTDSLTEERLAAIIYTRQGRGIMIFEGLSKWGYTKDALQQWAIMLGNHLRALKEAQ
jgi:hypothetical protein